MKVRLVPASVVLVFLLMTPAQTQEPNEKARRYYDALLKRPGPGAVFDRFYNAWLDSGTLEELEKFLLRETGAAGEAGDAQMVLATYYAKQNDHAKAAAAFGKALEKNPGSAGAWHQKAVAEAKLLDFTGALASLEKALAASPGKVLETQLTQLKGRLLAREGHTDQALKIWQQLLADSPGDAALQEDIIELQTAEGLHKEALSTAQALLEQTTDPYQKVQRRLRTGDLHARMGNRDAAVAAYTGCLEDTGADSWLEREILAQIEQIFRRDDSVEALRNHFTALLDRYPQRLSLQRRQAQLLADKGDVDGAVKRFQEILKLAPGNRVLREEYINLLAQSKKIGEAVAQMEELIRLQPADPELAARLAELQSEAGNAAGAIAAAELFLTKSDQSEAAFLRAAALLERCKQAEASLALYRRTMEKFPASEGAHDALALALHRNGRKAEAVAEWRKLAAGADKSRTANVARSAATRDEHALAWELLYARAAEFQDDPVFLTQLCDEATRMDKFKEALPYARRLVSLAKDAAAMEPALTIAMRMAARAKMSESLLGELMGATNPQDRCLLAELLEKAGRGTDAEAALNSVAAQNPELATALRVRLFTTRGDDNSAARVLQSMVEGPGGQKAAHVQRLVELLTRAGKSGVALRWIPVWKKLAPGSPVPWQREAALHSDAGNTGQALQTLRQAAALFDTNADLKFSLAAAYVAEAKFAEATRLYLTMYEEAKDIPDKVRFAGELARTAQAAGTTEDLIESFDERRRSNRTSLAPLLSLAEIHDVLGNPDARRTMLMEAARIAPENKDLRMEIVRAAESEENWTEAIQILRELAATDTTGAMQARLASTLFKAGRSDEALQLMSTLAMAGKVDARRAEAMAASLAMARSWRECAQFLAPLVTKNPDNFRLAWLHAVALEEDGETPAAIAAFRRLLTMPAEPAGTAAPSAQALAAPKPATLSSNPRVAIMLQMRDLILRLSPEYAEFTQFSRAASQAYSHKRPRAAAITGRASAANRPAGVTLPSSAEEMRRMTVAHLKCLLVSEGESNAKIATVLEEAGFRDAAFLVEITSTPKSPSRYTPPEILLKYPDVLMAQAWLAGMALQGSKCDPGVIANLTERVRKTRPELARTLALTLDNSDDPDYKKLCLDATKETLAVADRDPFARLAIFRMLLKPGAASSTLPVPTQSSQNVRPEILELIYPRMKELYRKMDPSDSLRSSVFVSITGIFIAKKDFAELIRFLDEELASGPPPPLSPSVVLVNGVPTGTLGPGASLMAVAFPQTGRDFPQSFTEVLQIRADTSTDTRKSFTIPSAVLRPLLPEVKDPVLRMLLATKSDNRKLMEECAPALEALEKPSLSAALLLAGWLDKRQAVEEAAAFLAKVPPPVLAVEQWRLDGALASLGLDAVAAADGKVDEKSPAIRYAREAVLRLFKAQLQFDARRPAPVFIRTTSTRLPVETRYISEKRQKLGDALKALGFKEEAKRLAEPESKESLTTNRPASPWMSATGSPGPPPGVETLTPLVESGRRLSAVQTLVKYFNNSLADWLLANARPANSSYARGWKEAAIKLNLDEDVLKALDPGSKEDAPALIAFGAAHEVLRGIDAAGPYYIKAAKLMPEKPAFVRLGLRGAGDSLEEVIAILANVNAEQLAGSSVELTAFATNLPTDRRVAALEYLNKWLEKLDPASLKKAELLWAWNWLNQFCHQGAERNGAHYGSLRGSQPRDKHGNLDGNIRLFRERWYAAAQKTAVLLMKNERQACAAFRNFIELRHQSEPDAARSVPDRMADEILTLYTARTKHGSGMADYSFYWLPGTADSWNSLSPGEWLLQSALLQKNPEPVTGAVIPRLRKAGAIVEADMLAAVTKLYFCTDGEFAAAALEAATAKPGRTTDTAMIRHVLSLTKKRNLDVELDAPLVKALKEGLVNGDLEHTPVRDYCLYLRQRSGLKAVASFYQKITEVCLGPAARRRALMVREFEPDYRSAGGSPAGYGPAIGGRPGGPVPPPIGGRPGWRGNLRATLMGGPGRDPKPWAGTVNGNMHLWAELTAALAREPELSLIMLSTLEKEFAAYWKKPAEALDPFYLTAGEPIGGGLNIRFFTQPPEKIMPAFRGTPALAEAAEFDLPLLTGNPRLPMPAGLFRNIRASNQASNGRPAFAAEPQTFGTEFIQAALDASPAEALLTLLGERVSELEKLPQEQQRRIAALHDAVAAGQQAPAKKSEAVSKGAAWLKSVRE